MHQFRNNVVYVILPAALTALVSLSSSAQQIPVRSDSALTRAPQRHGIRVHKEDSASESGPHSRCRSGAPPTSFTDELIRDEPFYCFLYQGRGADGTLHAGSRVARVDSLGRRVVTTYGDTVEINGNALRPLTKKP
jgi:hypothetical protein